MADNLQLPVMAGGEIIKADDMTTYKIEGVKLVVGADGVDGGYVSDANPLPIEGSTTVIGSVLPAGAASEDSLLDILAALGGALSITGIVAVSNFPSNFAVNNFPEGFLAAQAGLWTVGVNNFPATQPVSGTVAATQSGTWNVGTVASITNPVAVTGTFYQATQPVSIAAAVTIQDGGNVITVDGTVAATQSGTWNVGTVTAVTGITNPVAVTGTFWQATQPVSNAGTFAVQVSSALPTGANVIGGVTQSGTWNVGTVTTVSAVTAITNALPAGTNNIGDVDLASAIPAGSNLIGDVSLQGRTTGGLSIFRSIDLDETEEEVKGSAGTLYSLDAINMTALPLFLKVYDGTAASVTVGTTTPVLTYVLPTNGDANGCGMVKNIPQGLAFANGITVAVTTGIADNNTGAPAANAAIVNIGYK